jgi:hypothetical protein
LPPEISKANVRDEAGRLLNAVVLDWALTLTRQQGRRMVFAQLGHLPSGASCLFANDGDGVRWWVPLTDEQDASLWQSVQGLQEHIGSSITLFAHGALTAYWREWAGNAHIHIYPQAYRIALEYRKWLLKELFDLVFSLDTHALKPSADMVLNIIDGLMFQILSSNSLDERDVVVGRFFGELK